MENGRRTGAGDATHVDSDSDCDGDSRFTIIGTPGGQIRGTDEYSAANAFVHGQLNVQGDLCAAIRFFHKQRPAFCRKILFSAAARAKGVVDSLFNGRYATARNIRFHYDRSNFFYRQFLDSRMLYSAAHFDRPDSSLEEAQVEKLTRICRHLDLHPGERFLDVGCGWGALVVYAAEQFGVTATGCTLSRDQLDFSRAVVKDHGLQDRVTIEETDYRDLHGCFDKIASVGMFEHVGPKHLNEYFRKIHSLLSDRGLFLNRGIVRPETESVGPATLFLQKRIFPGGELARLADVMRKAEAAALEVLSMESLRNDYALTCHAWVNRLLENGEECRNLVGDVTYRSWLLYLAASAVSFEDGVTNAVEVKFQRRNRSTLE